MSKKVGKNHPTIGEYWRYTTDTIFNRYFRYLNISKIFNFFLLEKLHIYPMFCPISISDVIWYSKSPSHGTLTHWPIPVVNGSSLVYWLTPWTLLQGKNYWDVGIFFPGKQGLRDLGTLGSSCFFFFFTWQCRIWSHATLTPPAKKTRSSPTQRWIFA